MSARCLSFVLDSSFSSPPKLWRDADVFSRPWQLTVPFTLIYHRSVYFYKNKKGKSLILSHYWMSNDQWDNVRNGKVFDELDVTCRYRCVDLLWLSTQSNEKFELIWWEIERGIWMTKSPLFLDVIKIECAPLASYFVVSHPDLSSTLSKSSGGCLRHDHRLSWHWDDLSHSSIVSSGYSTGSQWESRVPAE